MGSVAIGAGLHLVNALGLEPSGELEAAEHFDIQQIDVENGIARPGRLSRNLFYRYRHPGDGRDLILFVGEEQPAVGSYAFCHTLLDAAIPMGVSRVITFASMASQLHPSKEPRVFGVATSQSMLIEAERCGAEPLREGQIGGLNGVLLSAGAERGVPGLSLLGEIPFFAAGVPNPKASRAVLRAFLKAASLEVDLSPLDEQAEAVDEALLQLLERMRAEGEIPEGALGMEPSEEPQPAAREQEIDPATQAKIETLFEEARQDRAKAFRLKEELDRLGVFEAFEDRFLDLFRRAE